MKPMQKGIRQKILFAPLDWGLGHATRCVQLIDDMLDEGHEVILCGSGGAADFLKRRYPALLFLDSPGYSIYYPRKGSMILSMIRQSPKVLYRIYQEHRWLKKIIRQHRIDKVISDNRYGMWSKEAESIFITHQINIQCPAGWKFLQPLLQKFVRYFISKYDECWIPDDPGETNLSGALSHGRSLPANTSYIGTLSRFSPLMEYEGGSAYDICVLLSGPEPHRSDLEKKVIRQLLPLSLRVIIVRGKPGEQKVIRLRKGFHLVPHLEDDMLVSALENSDLVICRSGYSTIMDLMSIGISTILVPTPGQTEQEYLAKYLGGKGLFTVVEQEFLNLRSIYEKWKEEEEVFRNDSFNDEPPF